MRGFSGMLLKITTIENGRFDRALKTCRCGFVIVTSMKLLCRKWSFYSGKIRVKEQWCSRDRSWQRDASRVRVRGFGFFCFFAWLSTGCQGLDVPTYSTKFGQNWDYSGRRNAWMTSVCPFSLPLSLSPLIFFYIVSSLLSPLSSCSSPRQSLIFFGQSHFENMIFFVLNSVVWAQESNIHIHVLLSSTLLIILEFCYSWKSF